MERHEIEIFLTLAEELHFGRTAQRLHVSTARVSQTVQRLERRVGAPLFERTSRAVSLTPLGRQFREDLAPAHRLTREAFDKAVAASRGARGVLRVGFLGPAAGDVVLDVMNLLRDRRIDYDVQVRETRLGDLYGPLRSGDIDLLLTKWPVREPDLSTGPVLVREPRMLAVSSRHRLARHRSVSVEDVADERLVDVASQVPEYWRDVHVPRVTPSGKPVRRGPAVTTLNEIMLLVAAGKGLCTVDRLVAQQYARPDVAYVPVHGWPPFESGLVWRTDAADDRIRTFAQTAAELARTRLGPASPGRVHLAEAATDG